jgi:hypothetical protein
VISRGRSRAGTCGAWPWARRACRYPPRRRRRASASVDEEVRMLGLAYAQLRTGQPSLALATLAEQERRFPDGKLAEPRQSRASSPSARRASAAKRAPKARASWPFIPPRHSPIACAGSAATEPQGMRVTTTSVCLPWRTLTVLPSSERMWEPSSAAHVWTAQRDPAEPIPPIERGSNRVVRRFTQALDLLGRSRRGPSCGRTMPSIASRPRPASGAPPGWCVACVTALLLERP